MLRKKHDLGLFFFVESSVLNCAELKSRFVVPNSLGPASSEILYRDIGPVAGNRPFVAGCETALQVLHEIKDDLGVSAAGIKNWYHF